MLSIPNLLGRCIGLAALACTLTAIPGEVHAQDREAALERHQSECESGSADACYSLGIMQQQQGWRDVDARRNFVRACEGGNPKGCNQAGLMFQEGYGGGTNLEMALQSFEMGCDLDYAETCYRAANLRTRTGGLKIADAQALKACLGDYAAGCNLYGIRVPKREDGTANTAIKRLYFRKACDLGSDAGCSNLANLGAEDR